MTPETARVVHRLPLHHRRADAGRSVRDARAPGARPRRRAKRSSCETGYPAYTTSVGWMGYSDDEVRACCREAIAEGWTHFKVKVGADPDDDLRRVAAGARGDRSRPHADGRRQPALGRGRSDRAHAASSRTSNPGGSKSRPARTTCSGTRRLRGRCAPIGVATGEHCANRVIFKQLLQASAIGFCQIDSCRLGGVNENLAVMLMAAKFGVPVCPHAGGVGLCEYVQHLSCSTTSRITGTMEDRVTEYVDHLHEHFVDPGRHQAGAVRPAGAGLQHRDQGGVAREPSLPGWAGLGSTGSVVTRYPMLKARAVIFVGVAIVASFFQVAGVSRSQPGGYILERDADVAKTEPGPTRAVARRSVTRSSPRLPGSRWCSANAR